MKDTFHNNYDTSAYGPLEVRTIKEDDYIIQGQFKIGTEIRYGRCVLISNDGAISDGFLKENLDHGPHLSIRPDGSYFIVQFENGYEVSGKAFRADGTPQ